MDASPLQDQCEAAGLLNTDTFSMTPGWGLTDEDCQMWEAELNKALEINPSWLVNLLNDQTNDAQQSYPHPPYIEDELQTGLGGYTKMIGMEDSTPSHHRIDVLPAPESRSQCRNTGLGACTKNIKMTDKPPSDRETWSDDEIDVLPVLETHRRGQSTRMGAYTENIRIEDASPRDRAIDTRSDADRKTEEEIVTLKNDEWNETVIKLYKQKYDPLGLNLDIAGVGRGVDKTVDFMAIAQREVADGPNVPQSTAHDDEMKQLIPLDDNMWVAMSDILGSGQDGKGISHEDPFQNNFVDGDGASKIKRTRHNSTGSVSENTEMTGAAPVTPRTRG